MSGRTPDPLRLTSVTPATPVAAAARSPSATLRHPHARGLVAALAEHGVIAGIRAPYLLRFGVNALRPATGTCSPPLRACEPSPGTPPAILHRRPRGREPEKTRPCVPAGTSASVS
ncbi:hypothetical protein [Streptomyces sp. NPDC006527]|uniref:kynureninase/PvdN C-terminal domain-containing protein n=1 Tax=Streptomyces sp. NPDC006527 TaxID=3364749 RepID=UPI003681E920